MPASQPAYFNLQQFTDNGQLLVGGRLYTYGYGTTAHKTAYIDPDGTIPHTYTADGAGGQYIALNARGELPAPLFLVEGSYDIALRRADGSTVWTRKADGVENSVKSWLASLTGSLGAALVGFIQLGAGAIKRTLLDKLREVEVNVMDFGADPASLDNLAAIQAAIDAVSAAGGGQVKIGANLFNVKGTLILPSYVELVGKGEAATRIRQLNPSVPLIQSKNFAALTGTNDSGGIRRAAIRRMTLEGTWDGAGPAGTNAQHGVQLYGYGNKLEHLHTRRFGGNGIETEWRTPGVAPDSGFDDGFVESSYNHIKSYENGLSGVKSNGPHDSPWNDLITFDNNRKDASAAKPNIWIGPKGSPQHMNLVHAWGNSSGVALLAESPVRLSNFTLEGASLAQLRIKAGEMIGTGGDIFAAGSVNSKGIEYVGGPEVCIGSRIDAVIRDCGGGAVDFGTGAQAVKLAVRIYQTSGNPVIGTIPAISVDTHLAIEIGGAGVNNRKARLSHYQGMFGNLSTADASGNGIGAEQHGGFGVLGLPQRGVEPPADFVPSSGLILYGRENGVCGHQMTGHKGALLGETLGAVVPSDNYNVRYSALHTFQAVGAAVVINSFTGGFNGFPFYILMPTGGAEITLSTAGNIKSKTGGTITRTGLGANRLIGFVLAKDGNYYQL